MATEIDCFLEQAHSACDQACCPACSGPMTGEMLLADARLLLAFCENCGHVLCFGYDGQGGTMLYDPPSDLWEALLKSDRGPHIQRMKQAINMRDPALSYRYEAPPPASIREAVYEWLVFGVAVGFAIWILVLVR